MKISFPILVMSGGKFTPMKSPKSLNSYLRPFLIGGLIGLRNGSSPDCKATLLIDINGCVYSFKKIRKRYSWTEFFSSLYDFTLDESEIVAHENISVAGLCNLIARFEYPTPDHISSFRSSAGLTRFLHTHNLEQMVSKDIIKAYFLRHCPRYLDVSEELKIE